MTQTELLVEQLKAAKAQRDCATVTIVTAEGSTPRSSGKMLVFPDGQSLGTIGGGQVEKLAREDAIAALQAGCNAYKQYQLRSDGIGMTCGGSVSVLIEVFAAQPRLVMCGAGHVGGALIRMAQLCGFSVTLLDTRPDEYIQDKIDMADRYVHAESFGEGMRELDIAPGAYFVIATFGHAGDGEALQAALRKEPAYVGMVGSKNKVGALFDTLRAHGVTEEALRSVYTPVGLDIGSHTPEEISLAVMAEIMMAKNGGTGKHLRDCDHK